MIQTVNPATELPIQAYHLFTDKQLSESIRLAHLSFQKWKKIPIVERQLTMLSLAALIKTHRDRLSRLITLEMGKPISQALAEIDKCSSLSHHYAEMSESYLQPRLIKTNLSKTGVHYQPLGLILGVMPWNFPFWQVLRFAIPCLMAGNGVLLKHAPISTGAGLAIAELFLEAGFPDHLFQTLLLDNQQTEKLLTHPSVVGFSFTGSEQTGRHLGAIAAASLKKSVLELGGSDPYIVLDDADLDLAARIIVTSRFNNCGQVCVAAKRVIAHQAVCADLTDLILKEMKRYIPGDPLNPATTLGPMARYDLRDTLFKQLQTSIDKGAQLMTGGKLLNPPGYFFEPALLTAVKPGMPAFDAELFGPVLSIISAENEQSLIRLANQSSYGLGAAIFTRNIAHGEQLAIHEIESGSCFVNEMVSSDPRVPFGGIKASGYGRELSQEGIREFVNIKTVAVR